jgi:hypothetical protein
MRYLESRKEGAMYQPMLLCCVDHGVLAGHEIRGPKGGPWFCCFCDEQLTDWMTYRRRLRPPLRAIVRDETEDGRE